MTVRFYSSVTAETTLVSAINNSVTSMQVASAVGVPSVPFTMAVDYESSSEELVEVTAVAGTTFTITRAIDGTSATNHNAGSRVRHVSSARDFADSRSHENASTNVHGLSGGAAVVGDTTTQTLTNKTLSGGTLSGTFDGTKTFSGATTFSAAANLNSGGALVGTFTGSPTLSGTPTLNAGAALSGTFSGNPTFSGTVTHTGLIQTTRSASTDVSLGNQVSGDTFDRNRIYASGLIEWGSGAAARDTNLYRNGPDQLKTDDNFVVAQGLVVSGAASVTGNFSANNIVAAGIGESLFARKSADTSRTNNTVTADPHLTVTVATGATYALDAYVIYTGGTTGDFGMQFGVPAGATGSWSGVGWGRGATASIGTDGFTVRMNENTITQNRTFGCDTTDITIHVKGILITAGTAGTFSLDWAQAVTDATATTVKTNSYIKLRRVA